MAIQNHPALYTGGNERFNLQPHVNLYAQLAAKKQARDEAFDEYIRSLNKNVNSAGMRNQERPIFDEKLAEWQKFGMENRDAIRNRKGGADILFQQKYQDLLNTIQESKTEEEKKKPAVEISLDPNKMDRVDKDRFMKDIQDHDAPIYIKDETGKIVRNPNRRSLDYNSITFNPKEFTTDDWRKYDEALTKAIPTDKTNLDLLPHPKDKYSQIERTSSGYSPEKLRAIGDVAKSDFLGNDSLAFSFRKTHPYEKWIKDNGKEFNKLNDAFKAAYGADASIQDEDDLFAAQQIQKRLSPTITEKIVDNKAQAQADRVALENLRNRNAIGRMRLSKALGGKTEEEEVDDEMINAFKDAYGRASNMAEGKTGVALTTLKTGTQALLLEKARKLLGDQKVSQGDIYIRKSGENKIDLMGIFGRNEKGTGGKSEKLGSIDFVDLNIPANTPLGVKAKREVMAEAPKNKPTTAKHPLPAGQPRTVKQGGFTYTWDENTGQYQ